MGGARSGGRDWIMLSNYGMFAFGDTQFWGSAAGVAKTLAVAVVASPTGQGYWQVTSDGTVYAFGDATRFS